ncbi:hypothetical protein R6Q59_036760 [Mikania micrantha]
MATNPMVPKFGDWENENNASYTTYFDKAQRGPPSVGHVRPAIPSPHIPSHEVNETQNGPPSVGRVRPGMRSTDPSPHMPSHQINNTTVVPRFGEWEASSNDPYTNVFNKIREERVIGTPMVARPYYNMSHNHKPNNKQCCCFPWSKLRFWKICE